MPNDNGLTRFGLEKKALFNKSISKLNLEES